MCKSYRQLAYDERCSIKALKSRGISLREIADQLGRSLATISLEIARNSGRRGYRHRQGQEKAAARHGEASGVPRKLPDALWHRIRALLVQGWSPEQIESRLKRQGEEKVGRESIYRQTPCIPYPPTVKKKMENFASESA